MYSRREFGQAMLAGLPLALALRGKIDATTGGVRLGTISYSFRDIPSVVGQNKVDAIIQDCIASGVGLIELMNIHVEPFTQVQADLAAKRAAASTNGSAAPATPQQIRDDLRAWRLATPVSYFAEVRKKFNDAGITIFAYTVNGFGDDFTDAEINLMFDQAQALGATTIASTATIPVAQKLVPYVEKHQFPVAFHNHSNLTDPNQFTTPESFEKALAMSKYLKVNLDIGHYTAANFDAVPFIEKHHADITHLHIKDYKRDQGPSMPWGQGDSPLKPVLLLVKEKHYSMPAIAEMDYPIPAGSTAPAEVKKCLDYMKQVLA